MATVDSVWVNCLDKEGFLLKTVSAVIGSPIADLCADLRDVLDFKAHKYTVVAPDGNVVRAGARLDPAKLCDEKGDISLRFVPHADSSSRIAVVSFQDNKLVNNMTGGPETTVSAIARCIWPDKHCEFLAFTDDGQKLELDDDIGPLEGNGVVRLHWQHVKPAPPIEDSPTVPDPTEPGSYQEVVRLTMTEQQIGYHAARRYVKENRLWPPAKAVPPEPEECVAMRRRRERVRKAYQRHPEDDAAAHELAESNAGLKVWDKRRLHNVRVESSQQHNEDQRLSNNPAGKKCAFMSARVGVCACLYHIVVTGQRSAFGRARQHYRAGEACQAHHAAAQECVWLDCGRILGDDALHAGAPLKMGNALPSVPPPPL